MPVYEYRCEQCGERIQRLEEMGADASGKRCPTCDDGVLKKAFAPFGTVNTSGSDSMGCSPAPSRRFK